MCSFREKTHKYTVFLIIIALKIWSGLKWSAIRIMSLNQVSFRLVVLNFTSQKILSFNYGEVYLCNHLIIEEECSCLILSIFQIYFHFNYAIWLEHTNYVFLSNQLIPCPNSFSGNTKSVLKMILCSTTLIAYANFKFLWISWKSNFI